jgi:hypothetical protein
MTAILPQLKFTSDKERVEHTPVLYALHDAPNLTHLEKHSAILVQADWMNINVQLLLPLLDKYPDLLNGLQPSPAVSKYIHDKYAGAAAKGTVAVHVRVRQPGDIMAQMKHPSPEWFVQAVDEAKGEEFDRIVVFSGISTAHESGKRYFQQIITLLSLSFPQAKVVIVRDEPCYVDFFALAAMPRLVITNSSFSFMAALLGTLWGTCSKVVVPDCLLDEFGIKLAAAPIPGFVCVHEKETVRAFE